MADNCCGKYHTLTHTVDVSSSWAEMLLFGDKGIIVEDFVVYNSNASAVTVYFGIGDRQNPVQTELPVVVDVKGVAPSFLLESTMIPSGETALYNDTFTPLHISSGRSIYVMASVADVIIIRMRYRINKD